MLFATVLGQYEQGIPQFPLHPVTNLFLLHRNHPFNWEVIQSTENLPGEVRLTSLHVVGLPFFVSLVSFFKVGLEVTGVLGLFPK